MKIFFTVIILLHLPFFISACTTNELTTPSVEPSSISSSSTTYVKDFLDTLLIGNCGVDIFISQSDSNSKYLSIVVDNKNDHNVWLVDPIRYVLIDTIGDNNQIVYRIDSSHIEIETFSECEGVGAELDCIDTEVIPQGVEINSGVTNTKLTITSEYDEIIVNQNVIYTNEENKIKQCK